MCQLDHMQMPDMGMKSSWDGFNPAKVRSGGRREVYENHSHSWSHVFVQKKMQVAKKTHAGYNEHYTKPCSDCDHSDRDDRGDRDDCSWGIWHQRSAKW